MVNQNSAQAAVTWSASSGIDKYNRPDLDLRYDIESVDAAIFDNSSDDIWFFLNMKSIPNVDIFNDSRGSWGGIQLDYNLDGNADISLALSDTTLKTDRTTISSTPYRYSDKTYLRQCDLEVYTNIDEGKKWIGFTVNKSCISLPNVFSMRGYADFIANDSMSFDYGPDEFFRVSLPGSSSTGNGSTASGSGVTYELPTTIANSSTLAKNFTESPLNLTKLSESLLPSVATVVCQNSSGTGWSAEVQLSKALLDDSYKSYLITNHHVVEDCLTSRTVSLLLNDKSTVVGRIVAWNESSDVASIATKVSIPSMQWIGAAPKQGWWIGVIGSPLGKPGILTTGIISSVNSNSGTFTMTAAINPGNSGGPVFDSTGRVLGLATSKNLISTGQIAEGFGNAHGVTLLCSSVIICNVENNPWGATSKFTSSWSASDLEAIAKAEAEAKAKADVEAKANADAEAKAQLAAKLREENFKACSDFNGDLKVKVFLAETSKTLYPRSVKMFAGLLTQAPTEFDCNYLNSETFGTQLGNQRKLLDAFGSSVDQAISNAKAESTRRITITCVKGKLVKKVTGVSPKCPAGYRKK